MKKALLRTFAAAVALLVIAFAVALLISRRPETLQTQLAQFDLLKTTVHEKDSPRLRDYASLDTWWWYLKGRPKTSRFRLREIDRVEESLIRLGYFEQREFVLFSRPADQQFMEDLGAALRTNKLADGQRWGIHRDSRYAAFRLVAYKPDMPTFARIVGQLDQKEGE
jgi:hypothetical protein